MYARVTTVQVHPDKLDEATTIFRDSVLPVAKTQRGFRTGYLLTDPAGGKGISVTIWDTLGDLQANDAPGFYQQQVAKFAPLFTAAPSMEMYEVAAQGQVSSDSERKVGKRHLCPLLPAPTLRSCASLTRSLYPPRIVVLVCWPLIL